MLFYKVEEGSSLLRADTIKIIPQYIHLMDIGTAAYTEYDTDATIFDVWDKKPELMGSKIGHIHSHNKMGVFFSGTDMDELKDNSENHHSYFSMIVNNRSEVVAKIAIQLEIETETNPIVRYQITDYSDEVIDKVIEDGKKFEKELILFVIDCKIQFPPSFQIKEGLSDFQARFEEVKKSKAKSRAVGFHQGANWQTGWQSDFDDVPVVGGSYNYGKQTNAFHQNAKIKDVKNNSGGLDIEQKQLIYDLVFDILNVKVKSDVTAIGSICQDFSEFANKSGDRTGFIESAAQSIFLAIENLSSDEKDSKAYHTEVLTILTKYNYFTSIRELITVVSGTL